MGGGADGGDTILPGSNFSTVDYGGRGLPVEVTVAMARATRPRWSRARPPRRREELGGGRGGDTLAQNPAGRTRFHLADEPRRRHADRRPGRRLHRRRFRKRREPARPRGQRLHLGPRRRVRPRRMRLRRRRHRRARRLGRVQQLREPPGRHAQPGLRGGAGEAGDVARLELRWRHPQGWRKLAKVQVRLLEARSRSPTRVRRPRAADTATAPSHSSAREQDGPTGKAIVARLRSSATEPGRPRGAARGRGPGRDGARQGSSAPSAGARRALSAAAGPPGQWPSLRIAHAQRPESMP